MHRATLPDGRAVVVKVQHRSARRMMRGDLANLSRLSGLLAATGMDLGFDHGSLIREYNLQVRCTRMCVLLQGGTGECLRGRGGLGAHRPLVHCVGGGAIRVRRIGAKQVGGYHLRRAGVQGNSLRPRGTHTQQPLRSHAAHRLRIFSSTPEAACRASLPVLVWL